MSLTAQDPMVVTEEAELRHLSASSLNDLLVCERRWAYARGVDPSVPKGPPNKWLTLGQSLHSAIRAFYDGEDPAAAARGAMQEGLDAGGDISLAEDHAGKLFGAFLKWHDRTGWKPTVQEQECIYDFEGSKIVGYIDARDDKRGVDWKSARKEWDRRKQQDAWLQATSYAIPTEIRDWTFVVFYYSREVKRGVYVPDYGAQEVRIRVTDNDIERFRAMVRAYRGLVQSTDINDFPIRPGSNNWLCSATYCDFWKVCPGGGRGA